MLWSLLLLLAEDEVRLKLTLRVEAPKPAEKGRRGHLLLPAGHTHTSSSTSSSLLLPSPPRERDANVQCSVQKEKKRQAGRRTAVALPSRANHAHTIEHVKSRWI